MSEMKNPSSLGGESLWKQSGGTTGTPVAGDPLRSTVQPSQGLGGDPRSISSMTNTSGFLGGTWDGLSDMWAMATGEETRMDREVREANERRDRERAAQEREDERRRAGWRGGLRGRRKGGRKPPRLGP